MPLSAGASRPRARMSMNERLCLSNDLKSRHRDRQRLARRIPRDHRATKRGELVGVGRRTGMVGPQSPVFGSEAERHRHLKIGESSHLPVKPGERVRTKTVSPR